MNSVRTLLAEAAERLDGELARVDAEVLLAHVLGRSRAWLFAWPEFEPDSTRIEQFLHLVALRRAGEPVAYLIGRRGFWSFDLDVTADVLIPRPETERLVELALDRLPRDAGRVADLGAGSGAIALAIASERPQLRVLATDASAAALEVARGNARRLGIANVAFAQGDWCEALGDACFDLIVSNPPYIETGDPHLARGDLCREPLSALASGVDGLDAIRVIAATASAHLVAGGWLLLEHGWDQAGRVRALLAASGFSDVSSARDAAGHERVTLGQR